MRRFVRCFPSVSVQQLAALVPVVVLIIAALTRTGDVRAVEPTAEQARLSHDIQYLASDDLEGRGVGTKGLNLAADFVRSEFAKAGLDVKQVEGGAFQKFTMVTGSELGDTNKLTLVAPDGTAQELKLGSDFQVCSFGGSGALDHEIVFCGYGIEDKEQGYNDFAGQDVKGKVVVIMRRVPQQNNPHGPFTGAHGGMSRHAELRTKVSNAYGHGAAAVLFVNDPYTLQNELQQNTEQATKAVVNSAQELVDAGKDADKTAQAKKKLTQAVQKLRAAEKASKAGPTDELMTFGYGGKGTDKSLPIAHIKQKVCNQLLKSAMKASLQQVESQIDGDLKPRTTLLKGWKLQGNVAIKQVRTEVKNVIGVLEGEGPLSDETIVIGAHYDHVGMGGAGSLARGSTAVHNGADDNASGTVSLLELARRLASRKQKLPRRLVFIAFTAEELGLIGSARYVKEPIFPLDQTICMFNMDMVGRLQNEKLTVYGTGTAPRWKKLVEDAGKQRDFSLALKPEGFGPSDHSSFYGKQIPVLHFFTGTHTDYHRPSDDWEKINFDGMLRVVDMLEDLVVQTATNADRPEYVAIKRRAQVQRNGRRPYFGSIPDFGQEAEGYAISGVAPESPAAKGGLKGGDLIVQFGKTKIGSLDDFDLALRKFRPGDEVPVTVVREGKRVTLKVKLTRPR